MFDFADAEEGRRDRLAWSLLNTLEMQRLRRVRQLGVSEFTFPGATHSRFAHSLGVFYVARGLARALRRLLPGAWDAYRAEVAVIAALLHDIGHGPFSHAFETVQAARGVDKDHEAWSAELILNPHGGIYPLLFKHNRHLAEDIAGLLRAKFPDDAYHAIVSSSFDADRLDYLRRDRLMTGSGAGAIDFDWLLDNLAVAHVPMGSDDDETVESVPTFGVKRKALQAAEAFLLARYQMSEQVYYHKATRGAEVLVRGLLSRIAERAKRPGTIGLDKADPLVRFFVQGGDGIENYLALDDAVVLAAAGRVSRSGDAVARDLARRLLERRWLRCLDVRAHAPRLEGEALVAAEARWADIVKRIDRKVHDRKGRIKNGIFRDVSKFSAYGAVKADQAARHKALNIVMEDESVREITEVSEIVQAIPKTEIVRYYFVEEADRMAARGVMGL